MDITTRCIHAPRSSADTSGAVSFPIYQTATFSHPGVGVSTGYDYSRVQNPTREHLEKILAGLESGTDALAFASGMAALTAMMELFSPGDHLIVSDDLYGGSYRLFFNLSSKNGLSFDQVDPTDLASLESRIRPSTKAVFVESPSNPTMKVADIAAISRVAKKHGLLMIVDNTFLSPYFQRPLTLGADIVLHSGTKYLGGHNDTLAGFLVVADPSISERLRFIYKTTGACLSPFDSWLLIRGIKTLAVRLDRQGQTASRIANWLQSHPRVKKVHYVGLPSHPDHELSQRQATGFGSMISFEVDSAETARQVLERVQLILYAESLGGTETLITYPILQTHADIPEDIRQSLGVTDRLLRLSVGLEHADDLIRDLDAAL